MDKSSKDSLQSKCKSCQKILSRKHYQSNKEKYADRVRKKRYLVRSKVKEIKESNPCSDCKIQYPFYVMQFDHIDEKNFEISTGVTQHSLKKVLAEISLCEIVCANCHASRSYERQLSLLDSNQRPSG